MPTLAYFAEKDLESLVASTGYGKAVTIDGVELAPEFEPSQVPLQLWRIRGAVGVRVPEIVKYIGADQWFQNTEVDHGWRLLHVGPADLSASLREFARLIHEAATSPSVKPVRKRGA